MVGGTMVIVWLLGMWCNLRTEDIIILHSLCQKTHDGKGGKIPSINAEGDKAHVLLLGETENEEKMCL